jgi:hypothetical protein
MAKTTARREAAEGASSCPIDRNDDLLTEQIDDAWFEKIDERICREFVRQLQQLENAVVTTNSLSRQANVRALEQLHRTLERIARGYSAKGARRAARNMVNSYEAYAALERRLYPLLEAQVAETDSDGVQSR